MRIIDWSSDVCSSDLGIRERQRRHALLLLQIPNPESPIPASPAGASPRGPRHQVLILAFAGSNPAAPATQASSPPTATVSAQRDRKSVASGKSVTERVDLGGSRLLKKKKQQHT